MRDFKPAKIVFLAIIAGLAFVLVFSFAKDGTGAPLNSSLAVFYQSIGAAPRALNGALTRVLPIDEIDEREFGEAIAARYKDTDAATGPAFEYINAVLASLVPLSQKGFAYQAYFLNESEPNACALPGGTILVTRGLLETLESEAELAAILAHEMAHVELGHCFARVRFELLSAKTGGQDIGWFVDYATATLFGASFGKTEEDDADEYAWDVLLLTQYAPEGLSDAFGKLLSDPANLSLADADLLRDYVASHPPLEIRQNKFASRAKAWRASHPLESRYLGTGNIRELISFADAEFPEEWYPPKP